MITQEDKELLSKDLCARLPYEVKVKFYDHWVDEYEIIPLTAKLLSDTVYIGDIRPYLFPLSSMTEEQKQEYTYIVNYISPDDTDNWKEEEFIYVEQFTQLMHFYHINHLDYMGLIPMGLAIDATGKNIY